MPTDNEQLAATLATAAIYTRAAAVQLTDYADKLNGLALIACHPEARRKMGLKDADLGSFSAHVTEPMIPMLEETQAMLGRLREMLKQAQCYP